MTSLCRECAASFTPTRHTEHFCSTACRRIFNNRRAMRGAELYDLFRAIRRERAAASKARLWTDLCRLEENWQTEDEHERPGRRSYVPPREAVQRLVDQGRISRRMTPAQLADDAEKRREANRVRQCRRVPGLAVGDAVTNA